MLRLASLLLALALTTPSFAQVADANAEARVHFERGNAALERARQTRGARQRRALEDALAAYVLTLGLVSSRNALFNAGIVLEQLERKSEAYSYFQAYLAIEGLSAEERADGEAHVAAIAPELAIVNVTSTPPGAEVFVDRLDLAAAGRAPISLALEAGTHTITLRLPHHDDVVREVSATQGTQTAVAVELSAQPVAVTFEVAASPDAELSVDGQPVNDMRILLPPGPHVARLSAPGRAPVEQRFMLELGEPLRVRMNTAAAALLPSTLIVTAPADALVRVDGTQIGTGPEVQHELRAGSHIVNVSAPGFAPYEQMVSLGEGQTVRVRTELAPESGRRLGAVPHIAAALTGATAVGFGVFAVLAKGANDDFNEQCPSTSDERTCEGLRDDVNNANTRADILLGVTGGLALTTLILYLANRRREGLRGDVQIVADSNGGQATFTRAF